MQPKEKTIREGLKHMREVAGGGGGRGYHQLAYIRYIGNG